jgi:hypothetical protein
MLKKIMLPALALAVAALWAPAKAEAYGAAHVGYTHVGPNGVYHTGATAVSGPGGAYGRTTTTAGGAYGATYHAGYGGASVSGGAYHYNTGYSAGGYHYSTGGATYGGYGYVR